LEVDWKPCSPLTLSFYQSSARCEIDEVAAAASKALLDIVRPPPSAEDDDHYSDPALAAAVASLWPTAWKIWFDGFAPGIGIGMGSFFFVTIVLRSQG
jgi:hypothetical protein